jgi:hypothetical protein
MDDQLENELMPNSSEAVPGMYAPELDQDPQQRQDEAEERGTMASALPLMEELMDWFGEQIQVCDSVAQVMQTRVQYKVTMDEALTAHDITRSLLTSKRESLRARIDAFMEGRRETDAV